MFELFTKSLKKEAFLTNRLDCDKENVIQSHIRPSKMWKSRTYFLILWLNFVQSNGLKHEVIGLSGLMKNFLSLHNTELIFISDFNSQIKVDVWKQFLSALGALLCFLFLLVLLLWFVKFSLYLVAPLVILSRKKNER